MIIIDNQEELNSFCNKSSKKPFICIDTEFMRAVETGDTTKQQQIVTQKQALRDVTTTDLSSVTTPEELKNVWPDILSQ